MLFILTGDVQIGKTRWLARVVDRLKERDVACYGVLAPGIWTQSRADQGIVREKVGIENVLLPEGGHIAFAERRDLAGTFGRAYESKQSSQAQLAWVIDDRAIDRVNNHFETITAWARDPEGSNAQRGMLFVDELGRLELECGTGLASAVSLVAAGPNALYPHALIVVRKWLCDAAVQRFSQAWPEIMMIAPDDETLHAIESLY